MNAHLAKPIHGDWFMSRGIMDRDEGHAAMQAL